MSRCGASFEENTKKSDDYALDRSANAWANIEPDPDRQMFWEVRRGLLPGGRRSQRPLIPPVNDELDRAIAAALKARGLTTANFEQSRCRGLVERPRLQPLRMILGKGLDPYFEMRGFWLPFAVEYAHVENEAQVGRRQHISGGLGTLRQAYDTLLRDVRAFADVKLYDHGDIWETSPFTPRVAPFELELAIDDVVENFTSSNFDVRTDLGAALTRLEKLALADEKFELHGNQATIATGFVGILALAYRRLAGKHPASDPVKFRDFLSTAFEAIDQLSGIKGLRKGDLSKLDAACKNILNPTSDLRLRHLTLNWLVCSARSTWDKIVQGGGFDSTLQQLLRNVFRDCLASHRIYNKAMFTNPAANAATGSRVFKGYAAGLLRAKSSHSPRWRCSS